MIRRDKVKKTLEPTDMEEMEIMLTGGKEWKLEYQIGNKQLIMTT